MTLSAALCVTVAIVRDKRLLLTFTVRDLKPPLGV